MNDLFSTSDLLLATVVSLHFPIEATEKTNEGKIIFYFKRSSELDKLIELFWKKQLKIEPQLLFYQLKFLKSFIYSDK